MAANNPPVTLCWDCANATGKCSWSSRLIPVKGWSAEQTKKKSSDKNRMEYTSYIVTCCPLFVRDATDSGKDRLKKRTDEK